MKIRKDDTVLIISGKDKGKKGKVLESFPKDNKVLVAGVNLRKKHQKPKRSGEKGQIIELPAAIDISNLKLICPKCGKAVKVGYILKSGEKRQKSKIRICKKCKQQI